MQYIRFVILTGSLVMQVSQMARAMVVNYGFSDIGPWSLQDPSAGSQDMIMRMMARNSMSENLQRKIDVAVRDIAAEAYEKALKHIRWVDQVLHAANGGPFCLPYLALCSRHVSSKCMFLSFKLHARCVDATSC